ncbi:hypothetical protein FOMPIDRAFT_1022211 [Fomitopsis schrenkii]|uniref:Uncharacterized protein n=1 Tax=Fomitopsis schrenkii TaxID=2126942 RepID=S8FZK6_FOMSC|nr:hypothetical protein FOMPIDRAFT_1022211 [Fomitopsis schrenkii]
MPLMHMRLGRPPLRDVPLEHFLLPADNIASPNRVIKRPLSPGGPSRHSPAKRRILAVDGGCSPQKSSENHDPSSPRSRRSSRRLSAALKGADSPSKKLDFNRLSVSVGAEKEMALEATSLTHLQIAGAALAPSPELRLNNGNSLAPSTVPHVHVTAYDSDVAHTHVGPVVAAAPSAATLAPAPAPHQPATPDRQSPHYPGFDIYCDFSATEQSTSALPQDMDVDVPSSVDDSQLDVVAIRREAEKENIQPRRARGSMGPPPLPGDAAFAKAGLLPPSVHTKLQSMRGRSRVQRSSMA